MSQNSIFQPREEIYMQVLEWVFKTSIFGRLKNEEE